MKSVLVICLVLGVVRLSQCLVCPKNFCESVDCSNSPTVDQCTNGVIRENGSYCGCCPVCIKYIPVDGSCSHLHLRGQPQTSTCEPPSHCLDGTCKLQEETDAFPDISQLAGEMSNEEVASEKSEEVLPTVPTEDRR